SPEWLAARPSGYVLHRVLSGSPKKAIRSVIFTPDGKSLITGSADRIIRWDAATGKLAHQFAGTGGMICTLALSRDGRRLAAGGEDGTVRLWDARTGAPVLPFDGHRGDVLAVAFRPDGQVLASAGVGGALIWDHRRARVVRSLGAESLYARAV